MTSLLPSLHLCHTLVPFHHHHYTNLLHHTSCSPTPSTLYFSPIHICFLFSSPLSSTFTACYSSLSPLFFCHLSISLPSHSLRYALAVTSSLLCFHSCIIFIISYLHHCITRILSLLYLHYRVIVFASSLLC